MCCGDLFLALIAILFPPIAVWIKSGLCSADSFINILLCMLGYFPGLIHAWYIIARNPERDYDYEPIDNRRDPERGDRVTYYYVSNSGSGGRRQYGSTAQPRQPQQLPQQGRPGPRQPGHQQQRQQQQRQQQQQGVVPVPSGSGAGSSSQRPVDDDAPPPPYTEAVRGDHKVQTQD